MKTLLFFSCAAVMTVAACDLPELIQMPDALLHDWATKSGIGLNVSPKDMGMTFDQFKQMVATYCEGSPMRFWNEARVGLASGR